MAVLAVSTGCDMVLIVGLMFGSLTSAIVGTLTYFSTAEQLQNLPLVLGESGNLSWTSIGILFLCVLVGLFKSFQY
jgi:iron complex transport system permease protein